LERTFNEGRRIVVGVNGFTEGNDDADLEILRITNADERRQVERLGEVRRKRNEDLVTDALSALTTDALDPAVNLMPALINSARANVTVGEMMAAMEGVFGRHVEVPTL
jgi:methylmalonyl-CoA mutase N-terminal domain/subunit